VAGICEGRVRRSHTFGKNQAEGDYAILRAWTYCEWSTIYAKRLRIEEAIAALERIAAGQRQTPKTSSVVDGIGNSAGTDGEASR
jgi:hypothetical protein